jgi:hypothetical protein
MKDILTEKLAARLLILIFSATIFFHMLVLLRVIPFQMVWGGRLKDENQMVSYETFSLMIAATMLFVVLLQAGLIKAKISYIILRVLLWLMTALFILNTLGNLFSTNKWERLIFTPVTLILAILCFRLAMVKTKY